MVCEERKSEEGKEGLGLESDERKERMKNMSSMGEECSEEERGVEGELCEYKTRISTLESKSKQQDAEIKQLKDKVEELNLKIEIMKMHGLSGLQQSQNTANEQFNQFQNKQFIQSALKKGTFLINAFLLFFFSILALVIFILYRHL